MLRMKRKYAVSAFIGVCLMLFNHLVSAQDSTQVLTLADAITRASSNNKSVQLAGVDEQIAQSNYKQNKPMPYFYHRLEFLIQL